ncbi:fructose PTS transporter subunit IIA [Gracilibacillus sp. S3-1-1]|uniref:Fructose PTS transporter subunit IIA n=1 Tax=Gracilibacillus pellucidus TaxID=3095368 RepID=A0ACC6M033_9BACI|nr:fructose PTS transporter subunit IIA [Gracilibacillus sp. S3-1-1]MDX8044362.1 fructose PTS transporter subunit IIA [Gracilibacillus sp. S3-1-1]
MLVSREQIYLDLIITDRDQLLRFISTEATNQKVATNEHELFQDFIAREDEYSTAFQEGIAIPHAKSNAVIKPTLFFAKLKNKVEWESPNDYKVDLVFAILVPKHEEGTRHVQILSALATRLMDDDFQEEIYGATDKLSVLNLLNNIEERVG